MLSALNVMQNTYFANWIGTWPDGIDWTRAVIGTYVAATLRTISRDMEFYRPNTTQLWSPYENVLSRYFEELIGYYFGQDDFAIRNQAFDDMLWVVLGWLETLQYIQEQNTRFESKDWHGARWVPAFAHRARIFWELASKGWDQKYCGGGMMWNPRLLPYKNAITNELFMSASIGMYLYFPGDRNPSPWAEMKNKPELIPARKEDKKEWWPPHEEFFWRAAQRTDWWLERSGMMNDQGLWTDGFHISGISEGSNNTKCDERDEMIYTYNQGVILSAKLGLFLASWHVHHLDDGHALIRNVIRSTGWDFSRNKPVDDLSKLKPGELPPWRGLGRGGVLEEACDISGDCSQDAQTFKGIWMHHFAAFCGPNVLDYTHARPPPSPPNGMREVDQRYRDKHVWRCLDYIPWLKHNVGALMGTKDENGNFGMWWTVGLPGINVTATNMVITSDALPTDYGEDDYRNRGVPDSWLRGAVMPNSTKEKGEKHEYFRNQGEQQRLRYDGYDRDLRRKNEKKRVDVDYERKRADPNSRGRGRTVETQGGALALLRAFYEVSKHKNMEYGPEY